MKKKKKKKKRVCIDKQVAANLVVIVIRRSFSLRVCVCVCVWCRKKILFFLEKYMRRLGMRKDEDEGEKKVFSNEQN